MSGNRHPASLDGVFELPVTPFLGNLPPAINLNDSKNIAHLHCVPVICILSLADLEHPLTRSLPPADADGFMDQAGQCYPAERQGRSGSCWDTGRLSLVDANGSVVDHKDFVAPTDFAHNPRQRLRVIVRRMARS
jgi:hypothetical protein